MADTDENLANRYLSATLSIPAGETRTFHELATLAGSPKAARAAGRAIASCPLAAHFPWQRVVASGGELSRDPGRAFVQLERLRAEGARPRDGESNREFAARVGKPWLGKWRGRRFVSAVDPRAAKFPAHAVEAFASEEAARERGFDTLDAESTAKITSHGDECPT